MKNSIGEFERKRIIVNLYLQDYEQVPKEMIDDLVDLGLDVGYPYSVAEMVDQFEVAFVLEKYGWNLKTNPNGYWTAEHVDKDATDASNS